MAAKVVSIAEQFTIDGSIEYMVYYDDGAVKMFKDYPTDDDLHNPNKAGWKVR